MFLLGGVVLFCGVLGALAQDYEVPVATVQTYFPKGLRVSIPDENGIRLFAFHGKINEEFNGREAGTFARDITSAKDGRWTFFDPQARLKVGDILYYWTTVYYHDGEKQLAYYRDDQEFRVQKLLPLPDNNKPGHGNNHGNGNGNKNNGNKNNGNKNKHTTQYPDDEFATEPPQRCNVFSKTVVNDGKQVCQGQLIFQDNFETFDMTKWKKDVYIPASPDYEFVLYMNYPENIAIKDNNLCLKPTLASHKFGENFINEQINLGRNCTGVPGTSECDRKAESFQILPPVFSGRVKTKDHFSFRYGTVEIRAKFPRGKWIYPELFLQPKSFEYGLNYDSGQIRVAISAGNTNLGSELQGGVILGTSTEAREYGIRKSSNVQGLWSDSYHVYTMQWRPEGIQVSVDGYNYGVINPPARGYGDEATNLKTSAGPRWSDGGHDAPFDREMFLVLGVGVGGHNFADSVDDKPWKNKSPKSMLQFWTSKDNWYNTWNENSALLVDYVKVWAL